MPVMTTTSSTALSRTHITAGVAREYEAFAALVESLTQEQWATPSRCAGFDVRDVAGHVIGLAEDTAAGKPGSRTAAEEAATVRDDPPARAAERLRTALGPMRALLEGADDALWDAPIGVNDLTLGQGALTLWYDTYVHADDIRAAIGQPSARGDGLGASVSYLAAELTKRGYGPATLALDGVPVYDVNGGGAAEITGDPLQFVLIATGRADPAAMGLDPSVNIYGG
jgi:uncharacterized protein (TIGR03083 family)